MCCKDTGADFMFAWPIAKICIVGAETAASIIFAREIKEAEDPKAMKAQRIAEYRDLFENPYCAAERGFIDDVIMPSETRKYINRALDMTENKKRCQALEEILKYQSVRVKNMTTILAPMPGKVTDIKVKVGEEVTEGQELLIIEAMKMQMPVKSPQNSKVSDIKVEIGQGIKKGDVMIELD